MSVTFVLNKSAISSIKGRIETFTYRRRRYEWHTLTFRLEWATLAPPTGIVTILGRGSFPHGPVYVVRGIRPLKQSFPELFYPFFNRADKVWLTKIEQKAEGEIKGFGLKYQAYWLLGHLWCPAANTGGSQLFYQLDNFVDQMVKHMFTTSGYSRSLYRLRNLPEGKT